MVKNKDFEVIMDSTGLHVLTVSVAICLIWTEILSIKEDNKGTVV